MNNLNGRFGPNANCLKYFALGASILAAMSSPMCLRAQAAGKLKEPIDPHRPVRK
jgi:hypothetical protein